MKKLYAALAVTTLFAGCASVPMGDAKQDAALKEFKVAPDQAAVYVYRSETMGAAATMHVKIDGKPLGDTAAKTYLYTTVTPGHHTITSEAENTDTLEVDLKAGTPAYVWQEVKMGIMSARSKLHLVSEPEGQAGVKACSLAATASK